MPTITIAVKLEINDDLSEEALDSITSELISDLSNESFKTLIKMVTADGTPIGKTGTVNVNKLDEIETAKAGARAVLEAQAVHCEGRADEHDIAVLIALAHNPTDPDTLEDIHIESGVAGGFRAAAVYAREAIAAL